MEVRPVLRFFRTKGSGIPTLYIMGSEDYMFLPSIKKLAQENENEELVVIKNCGHVVNVDAPEIFNERALAFMQNVRK